MAHEDPKLCAKRVPPQKNDELSGLKLKATANGNRLFLATLPFTIGLGRGDDFDRLIIDIKRHQVNNA